MNLHDPQTQFTIGTLISIASIIIPLIVQIFPFLSKRIKTNKNRRNIYKNIPKNKKITKARIFLFSLEIISMLAAANGILISIEVKGILGYFIFLPISIIFFLIAFLAFFFGLLSSLSRRNIQRRLFRSEFEE